MSSLNPYSPEYQREKFNQDRTAACVEVMRFLDTKRIKSDGGIFDCGHLGCLRLWRTDGKWIHRWHDVVSIGDEPQIISRQWSAK